MREDEQEARGSSVRVTMRVPITDGELESRRIASRRDFMRLDS